MLFELLISALLCLGFVFFSIPAECRSAIRQNCQRLNGTVSSRRTRRELSAATDYLTTMIAPLILIFATSFAAITYVSEYLIPVGLVVDSFAAFDWNPAQWKEDLSDVRRQHTQFAQAQGMTAEETTALQRSLWMDWQAMLAVVMFLMVASIWVIFTTAKQAVSKWASGIRLRRKEYLRTDVQQMKSDRAVLPQGNAPKQGGSRL